MAVDVHIASGDGTRSAVKVSHEGALHVVTHPHPPPGEVEVALPFRARFMDSSGSDDMTINGSTTNVEYYISSSTEYDRFVKFVSVIIGDGGSPALNKFGELTALTNGVRFHWDNQATGELDIHDGIKTNIEFIRLGGASPAFGDGVNAFLADVSGGGTEKSYLVSIDMAQQFGTPYGIRLRKATTDRLVFTIRDDLSGLITMNAIAYGIQIDGEA